MTQSSDYTPAPAADFVLPFDLPKAGMRGRFVRLEAASAQALSAHALPEDAARIAAEALVLSALLGSSLKLNGRLSVQMKGSGPLDLVASDYFGAEEGIPAGVRAYGRFAGEAGQGSFAELAGEGSLAITIEPRLAGGGAGAGQTYQGIVALSPQGLARSAEVYFGQSEQLLTSVKLAAAPLYEKGAAMPRWRAAGLLLQATPEGVNNPDDWERLTMHMDTLEDFELLDTGVAAETLLWRLFNEDEVRVHPSEDIAFRCTCDTSRIAAVLQSYSDEDRKSLADSDGIIRARCEFCGASHEISA